jgi:hypothetical protein
MDRMVEANTVVPWTASHVPLAGDYVSGGVGRQFGQ